MNIHEFDANNATEEVLLGLNRIVASVEAEALPDDEPVPFQYRVARWQAPSPEHQLFQRFYAEEGGEIVGYLNTLRLPIDDPAMLSASIWWPRSTGVVGWPNLLFMLDWSSLGIERLTVDVAAVSPTVLERLGMRHRDDRPSQSSRAWLCRLSSWIGGSGEPGPPPITSWSGSSPGFRTSTSSAGPGSERHEHGAPEDAEWEDFEMTPEKWRAEEDNTDLRGDDYLAIGALHVPSGEFAGLTDVFLPRLFPSQVWQEDTGVDPAHRNKGLGRWLKAEMLKWIASSRPEAKRIDTFNAGSNEPMLAINVEMGFEPILVENVWQATVEEVRANLSPGSVAV